MVTQEDTIKLEKKIASWVRNVIFSVQVQDQYLFLCMEVITKEGLYRFKIDITNHYDKEWFKSYVQNNVSQKLHEIYFS
jgi:hypothetical protein